MPPAGPYMMKLVSLKRSESVIYRSCLSVFFFHRFKINQPRVVATFCNAWAMLGCIRTPALLWAPKSHTPVGLQITRLALSRPRPHVARTTVVAVCQNTPRKGTPASTTSWTPFGWELNPKYDSNFIQVGRYRAHYLAAGTSETVILILASQVVTARSYRSTLNALSRTYRVICLELPGCGRSDHVSTPFKQQESADWLAQFLKQMDIGSAVVIGHSCSGAPAIVLAQTHSDFVSHLVLVGSIGVVHYFNCFSKGL